MRNLNFKFLMLVTSFLLFGYVAPCQATIQLMGSAEDQAKFKDMLQTGVGNDATVNVDSMGNVTLMGTPKSEFGKRLKTILDDKSNAVMLFLEKLTAGRSDQPNGCAIFGAFNRDQQKFVAYDPKTKGNGKHSINVADFMMMPTDSNTGVANQQAILMHEIWETYDGLKNGHNFMDAHQAGIEAELAVMKDMNGNMDFTRISQPVVLDDNRKATGKEVYVKTADGSKKTVTLMFDNTNKDWALQTPEVALVTGLKEQYFASGCTGGGLCAFDFDGTNIGFNQVAGAGMGQFGYVKTAGSGLCASVPAQNRVVRIRPGSAPDTYVVDKEYTDPALLDPQGVDFNPETQELFVASRGNNQVVVFSESGPLLRTLRAPCISQPYGLTLDGNGNVWVANGGNNSICSLRPDGTPIISFTHPMLNGPRGLAISFTAIFVVSTDTGSVLQFDFDGRFRRTFASGLSRPNGIALVGEEPVNLFMPGPFIGPLLEVIVASTGSSAIAVYLPDGTPLGLLTNAGVQSPIGVAHRFDIKEKR